MARPSETRTDSPSATSEPLAAEILDRFLEWCQKNRAAETYRWHKYFFQSLYDALPVGLPASGLKPYHLTAVMDAQPDWGNNTKHNFVTAVNRAFNWAWKQEIIDRNPVAHTEKPAREARELAATPADFAEVIAAIAEPNFRDLVRFAWESGVRPQEVRAIEARHIDFAGNRIVFPPKESKGKKRHRVVYLTPEAADILRPFAEASPTGPVFLNSEGAPWNKNSINCAFCRLKKKLGRKLHMGAFRKGYATEGLKSGVDVNTMAHLMGHTNGVMLAKVYARVQTDPAFMAEAAVRAKKPRGT
jgi:integrase